MKDLLTISLALLICGCSVQKKATLVLPAKIALSQVDALLLPVAEINWDEDEPVAVDVALNTNPGVMEVRDVVTIVGSWSLYDVNDKEVGTIDHSMGGGITIPRGTILVTKRYPVRLPFDPRSRNTYSNLKPGRYYVIASFSGSLRTSKVRFTTEKRWFEITDEH